ncbi:hypothetical protein Jab_1c21430 [Janthinobacterium sp. HH01]|uniref:hypothetical protein n=1 Tax=Janthinobacterium sp. HH01 TaxID=1198452 RepID=UPI0002AEC50F|nr:hypothetical protein [Janthinobacterium sp. HH01]ELX13510.1 hypothetical protein Jab_1c21430 [Janthinobacterium sp. HH01]
MDAHLIFDEFKIALPQDIHEVVSNFSKPKHRRGHIDILRTNILIKATGAGVKLHISTQLTDPGSDSHKWLVYLNDVKVGKIVQKGIREYDEPRRCPACGKEKDDWKPKVGRKVEDGVVIKPAIPQDGTRAHDVVSAAVWKRVFDKVFAEFKIYFENYHAPVLAAPHPAADAEIAPPGDKAVKKNARNPNMTPIQKFEKSIRAVGSSTEYDSNIGPATSGDRRTCKQCEELQAHHSLRYRVLIASNQRDEKRFVGRQYYKYRKHADIITKFRILDVVKGIRKQIKSREYLDASNQYTPEFQFLTLVAHGGPKRRDFFKAIAKTAFEYAGSHALINEFSSDWLYD